MAKTPLHCGLTLRLYREEKVFGPGVAELLETVRDTRSLRSAAMRMDMAYSKAWKVIKEAEKGMGFSLLDTATGGKQGGGATLTQKSRKRLHVIAGEPVADTCFPRWLQPQLACLAHAIAARASGNRKATSSAMVRSAALRSKGFSR